MNMPSSKYNEFYKIVRDWEGSKEGLQRLYDEVYYEYDDGREMLRRVDPYQSKYRMDLH